MSTSPGKQDLRHPDLRPFKSGTKSPEGSRRSEGSRRGAVTVHRIDNSARRGCTDLFFLLLFTAALGLLGFVFFHGLKHGDFDKVIYGQDYMSDLCGVDNSERATGLPPTIAVRHTDQTFVEALWPFSSKPDSKEFSLLRGMHDHRERKFLYFAFPLGATSRREWQNIAVCRSDCPHPANSSAADDPASWVCTGKWQDFDYTAQCLVGGGLVDAAAECEAYRQSFFAQASDAMAAACQDPLQNCHVCYPPYKSVPVLNFCLPDPAHALETFNKVAIAIGTVGVVVANPDPQAVMVNQTLVLPEELTARDISRMRELISTVPHRAYEDIVVAMPVIISCSAGAVVSGLLWLLLLRILAGSMVWLSLVGAAVGMGVGCWWLWGTQVSMRGDDRYGTDDVWTKQADAAHGCFYGSAVVSVVYTLLLLLLRKKIAVAARVIEAASRAMHALPLLLLLPPVLMAASLAALAYGVGVAMLFVSCGELQRGRTGFGHISLDGWQESTLALHCVATIWLVMFIRHVQHCTVAGAIEKWWFTSPDKRGEWPVLSAVRRTLRYHAGSVALGSLLITSLKLVRWTLLLVRNWNRRCGCAAKCLKLDTSERGWGRKCFGSYVSCCFYCVERFLLALTRYAYAQMMVSGRPFGQSALDSLSLLTENMGKAAAVRLIGSAFLFVGKLAVAVSCATVGALILLTQEPYTTTLYSVVPPIAAIVIASYVVAMIFFGVYNMCIDTIFLCVCRDKERAKLGLETHASPNLMRLLRPEEEEERSDAHTSSTAAPSAKGEVLELSPDPPQGQTVLEDERSRDKQLNKGTRAQIPTSDPWMPVPV